MSNWQDRAWRRKRENYLYTCGDYFATVLDIFDELISFLKEKIQIKLTFRNSGLIV